MYRLEIQNTIERAFGNIALACACDPKNGTFTTAMSQLKTFEGMLTKDSSKGYTGQYEVIRRTDGKTQCYIKGYVFYATRSDDGFIHFGDGGTDANSSVGRYAICLGRYYSPTIKDDFQEDERNEFVKRMSGRDMGQETSLAGINWLYSSGIDSAITFYRKREYDGGWYALYCRHYYHQYAWCMKPNDKEMVYRQTYREYNDSYNLYSLTWRGPNQ